MSATAKSNRPGEITYWCRASMYVYNSRDPTQQRRQALCTLRLVLSTDQVLDLTHGWSKRQYSILLQDLQEFNLYDSSEEEEDEFYYGEEVQSDDDSSDSEADLFGLGRNES